MKYIEFICLGDVTLQRIGFLYRIVGKWVDESPPDGMSEINAAHGPATLDESQVRYRAYK